MEKITKKEFIKKLCAHKTTLCGNVNNKSEDFIIGKLDGLKIADGIILEKRDAEMHSSFVEFTGGSRMYFDQKGKYSFYSHTGKSGLDYLICILDADLTGGETWTKWTIYILWED